MPPSSRRRTARPRPHGSRPGPPRAGRRARSAPASRRVGTSAPRRRGPGTGPAALGLSPGRGARFRPGQSPRPGAGDAVEVGHHTPPGRPARGWLLARAVMPSSSPPRIRQRTRAHSQPEQLGRQARAHAWAAPSWAPERLRDHQAAPVAPLTVPSTTRMGPGAPSNWWRCLSRRGPRPSKEAAAVPGAGPRDEQPVARQLPDRGAEPCQMGRPRTRWGWTRRPLKRMRAPLTTSPRGVGETACAPANPDAVTTGSA